MNLFADEVLQTRGFPLCPAQKTDAEDPHNPGISGSRLRESPCGSDRGAVLPALWGPGADVFTLFMTAPLLAELAVTWKKPRTH